MYCPPQAVASVVLTSAIESPSDAARRESTSMWNCGVSSCPFGRTLASRLLCAAMPRNWLRAATSASWPRPALSFRKKSKPPARPSSGMGGGANAKAIASLICIRAPIARPATASTCSSAGLRSSQFFRLMNAVAVFCPLPPKLKPCTPNTETTVSFSSSRKCRSTFSSACIVRCWVAPTGVITCANKEPWSSAGRNALGNRTNSTPSTTSSAAKIAMKRPLRPRMPTTRSRYRALLRSNAPLNQRKKPVSPWCSPCFSGVRIVAHSAGVSTMATSTDSAMAETIVAENCR